ncbi:MAG: hypothetical protein OXU33_01330 [Gemmatimonadota bacterium]|nr:hypothetical protein [Gemmatimonadota bacterium]MDE3005500.1 hypothetical protein [Gemmatimonadota bacterium]MDE3012702.1 hypothetical protein [Gemmatimonadota bacterium]
MKNAPLLPLLALATLLAGCQVTDTPTQEPQTPEETASAEAAFDAIKSLEGTWEGTLVFSDGREMPTSNEFKVVSGGNTVVETLIEGDVEMATTYTMEGGTLLAKHYCVLGTEPTFEVSLTEDGTIELTPTANTPYTVGEDDFVTGMTFDISDAAAQTISRTGVISEGGEDVTNEAVLTKTTGE